MRYLEQAAIASGAVTGRDLMERAGAGVVAAVLDSWPDLARARDPASRAVVLCGPGNNGGDGYVIARLLAARGWAVTVHALGDPARLPPDAAANHAAWARLGAVHPLDALTRAIVADCDLLVDAVFGTGLTRPFALPAALAEAGRPGPGEVRPRVVAVDIVSGLDADSGRVLGGDGATLAAHLTVTFHAARLGHALADGPEIGGALVIADIGLPADLSTDLPIDLPGPPPARAIAAPIDPASRAALGKGGARHKYDHGHALVVSGPMGRSGAARLAARAALRVGAGLVTVAAPGSAMLECACQLTAAMLRRCDGAEALAGVLQDPRIGAICLGPGMGLGAETQARVQAALAVAAERPLGVVLDADALSAFAEAPERLFAACRAAGSAVLTPHGGEFARLFPDLAERLAGPAATGPAFSRADAGRAAAARAGAVVLLKGPDTVIAAPGGQIRVHVAAGARAAPWLATAGSGDVLAGMIAGLMARGVGGAEAARLAVWLHAEAARAFGPGLIAEDLPEALPGVFRGLGL